MASSTRPPGTSSTTTSSSPGSPVCSGRVDRPKRGRSSGGDGGGSEVPAAGPSGLAGEREEGGDERLVVGLGTGNERDLTNRPLRVERQEAHAGRRVALGSGSRKERNARSACHAEKCVLDLRLRRLENRRREPSVPARGHDPVVECGIGGPWQHD